MSTCNALRTFLTFRIASQFWVFRVVMELKTGTKQIIALRPDLYGRWEATLRMSGSLTKFFGGPNLFETPGTGRNVDNPGEMDQITCNEEARQLEAQRRR